MDHVTTTQYAAWHTERSRTDRTQLGMDMTDGHTIDIGSAALDLAGGAL